MPQLQLVYQSTMDQTVKESDVRYIVPQSQGISVDCGAFAVANAISVIHNIEPSTILVYPILVYPNQFIKISYDHIYFSSCIHISF